MGGSILQTGFTVNSINAFDSVVQVSRSNVDFTNKLIKLDVDDIRRAFFNADGTLQAGKSVSDYEKGYNQSTRARTKKNLNELETLKLKEY